MASSELFFIYAALAMVVSAIGLRFLRTPWVYLAVASLLPPMTFIGVDALWRGGFSVWDDIVFIILTLISFGIALALLVIRFAWLRMRRPEHGPSNGSSR